MSNIRYKGEQPAPSRVNRGIAVVGADLLQLLTRFPAVIPKPRLNRQHLWGLCLHAKRTASAFAAEVWVYRHVEGIANDGSVTFIDKTDRGDFHLAQEAAK